jgi:hypothetical protein
VEPERRLWVSHPGFATVIVGLIVFCGQVDRITSYNVTPIVGIAIAAFGDQIITTALVTCGGLSFGACGKYWGLCQSRKKYLGIHR